MNTIKRKQNEIMARKIINKLLGIKFIKLEDENSLCVKNFRNILRQFHSIESIPADSVKIGQNRSWYILWAQRCLNNFKDNKEWLILVPNCNEPVWANVLVTNFNDALSSLWDISQCNEFVISDKNTQQIVAIFCEEKCYEFHNYDPHNLDSKC